VLTAGLGTRLRPLTDVRAKPAIPVAGTPMIRRIGAWLVSRGVDDLVLNLHHLPETLTACLGDGRDLGARVRYSWEQPVVLGSAGGPRRALPIIGATTFFIVNGDTLTDLSLAPVAAAHAATHALVTMALVPNRAPDRYGGVRMGEDGQISGFVSRGAQAVGSYHFIGVQIAESEVFADVKDGDVINSTRGVYDILIASQPGSIRGYLCEAAFWDIGTPEDYAATDRAFTT
jgi:NDP-sugar pyrophosphorylase family protein